MWAFAVVLRYFLSSRFLYWRSIFKDSGHNTLLATLHQPSKTLLRRSPHKKEEVELFFIYPSHFLFTNLQNGSIRSRCVTIDKVLKLIPTDYHHNCLKHHNKSKSRPHKVPDKILIWYSIIKYSSLKFCLLDCIYVVYIWNSILIYYIV